MASFFKNKCYYVTSCLIWVRDNDVMRGTLVLVETGGREKSVKPTGGEKFIASNPRGVHAASRGEIWRVESMVNGGYSTTNNVSTLTMNLRIKPN